MPELLDDDLGEDLAPELRQRIYQELRGLCAVFLRQERPDHTLQATALAHEVILRLARDGEANLPDAATFRLAASRTIRRILVDHARRRSRLKRGGNRQREQIPDVAVTALEPEILMDLSDALDQLRRLNPRHADVIDLVFFGGLTQVEAASTLNVSERTIRDHWHFARAWLHRRLSASHIP